MMVQSHAVDCKAMTSSQLIWVCRGIAVSLRDQGSMEGLQFTNITIESLFYEQIWLGGAEPIHITAMPRAVNTEVSTLITN